MWLEFMTMWLGDRVVDRRVARRIAMSVLAVPVTIAAGGVSAKEAVCPPSAAPQSNFQTRAMAMKGGIEVIAETICEDMRGRLPGQNKKQREGLALLTATMVDVRSANLMDLAASLPRQAERLDMRCQWISRVLGNGDYRSDPGERGAAGRGGGRPRWRTISAPDVAGQDDAGG